MKILFVMSRFTVAEGKLRRPTVAEAKPGFLCSGSSQRRECSFYPH